MRHCVREVMQVDSRAVRPLTRVKLGFAVCVMVVHQRRGISYDIIMHEKRGMPTRQRSDIQHGQQSESTPRTRRTLADD
jgi:hypothetical protein